VPIGDGGAAISCVRSDGRLPSSAEETAFLLEIRFFFERNGIT
jgi:hypothetical protein